MLASLNLGKPYRRSNSTWASSLGVLKNEPYYCSLRASIRGRDSQRGREESGELYNQTRTSLKTLQICISMYQKMLMELFISLLRLVELRANL
ncbi:uncharacterized protein LOC142633400 isoform X3 [Castanea sativa]|uniref:uncharacterized protein LOC142633400 isoform X3 n=1 Tax=Castanea sativa TaxID=21020 RepID=UPI003F649CAC